MKCPIIIFLLFLILPIVEIYLNYNETDFPEYHEKRIKFNVCSLFTSLIPIVIIISALCGPCCVCITIILTIIASIAGFYYAISSFYLYFAYDGSKRIKSPAIRIVMWISFVNFIINLCSNCSNSRQSASSTDFGNKDSNLVEMEEQKV